MARRSRRTAVRTAARFGAEALEGRVLLSAVNVLSYHNDAASTGANLQETALTSANVNASTFGKLFSTPVDGQIYAQPLYMAGVNVTAGTQQGTHNVAYVATAHDSLYAIDGDTGTVLWQDTFLVPSAALTSGGHTVNVTTPSNADVNTNDISPEIGIISTPAIDPATGFLYLTAKTKQVVDGITASPHYVQVLYKVDVHSGAYTGTVIGDTTNTGGTYTYNSGPYTLDPLGNGAGKVVVGTENRVIFNAQRQLQRSGVTLYNGHVYLAFASHGDNNPYHGWILGYDETSLAPTAVFNTTPDGTRGGIWMGGGKIAIDPGGYMYVMTGNGTFDTTLDANSFPSNGDYGDSFIKIALDPSTTAASQNINGWGLKVVDYFTPMNQSSLNSADQDLGSGGPVILPDAIGGVTVGSATHPQLLIGTGKQGLIYVIDRNSMGKFSSTTDNVVQEFSSLGGGGSYDTPAFFYDGTSARIYYVAVSNKAKSFTISNATLALSASSNDTYGSRCATTSIAANGTANGIAWNIDPGSNTLRAYNASNMAQELWTSADASFSRDALGVGIKFTAPTVTNGEVFAGTSNALVAYGLLVPPTTTPAAPSNLTAAAASGVQVNLAWQDNANNEGGFYVEASSDNGATFNRVATANVNATSYSVTGLTPGTAYVFRVQAFNVLGVSAYTPTASATTISPPPAVDFSGGFSGATLAMQLNGTAAKIVGGKLQLTDGAGNEASSAFYKTAVSVSRFSSTFSFQYGSAVADGLTFTIQNAGATAVGGGGGSLGYGPTSGTTGGIGASVALKFDIFSNSGEGTDSTGVYTNGANPSVTAGSFDMTSSGVILRNGNVMLVSLAYDGTTLSESITDTVTHATYTRNYVVDIPGTVGGTTALVGFTGATGGSASIQNILGWSFTPLPSPPSAPANLTVTPSSGTELDVSWTATSAPVDHYTILRQTSPGVYTQVGQVPGSATVYPDGGLTPNTTYAYEVVANNASGDSPAAGPVSGTTPIAPAAPTGLIASNVTASGVSLTWLDNAGNETGYKITRQLESDNSIQLATLPANSTTFTDSTLLAGSVYEYTVAAYNAAGPSDGAIVVIVTLPAAPSGVTAVGQAGQVQINWVAPKGATSYNVYRGTSAGGEDATPIATGVTGTAYADTGLPAGSSYYYRVAAVNSTGEGARGAEVSARVSTLVANGTPGADSITLSQDPDHQHVDWAIGSATGQVLISEAGGLTINGNGGSDVITLIYTNGNPLPGTLHLNGTFTINGLEGSNPLANRTLEIGRSTIYFAYGAIGADPVNALRAYLANGYAGGTWAGAPSASVGAITSLAAANNPNHNTGIGWADFNDGTNVNTTTNTVELKYTLNGDTTLDGAVDIFDLNAVLAHYNGSGAWTGGDSTYNGGVDIFDLNAILANYNTTLGGQAVPAATPSTGVPAIASSTATATPASVNAAASAGRSGTGTATSGSTLTSKKPAKARKPDHRV